MELTNYIKYYCPDLEYQNKRKYQTSLREFRDSLNTIEVLKDQKQELDNLIKANLELIDQINQQPTQTWFSEVIKEMNLELLARLANRLRGRIEFREGKRRFGDSCLTEEEIERARQADCSLLVEVLRVVGGKQWARCPFHEDKTPSLCCFPDGRGFYCFGCHVGGDAISLAMKLNQELSFKEAVKMINELSS